MNVHVCSGARETQRGEGNSSGGLFMLLIAIVLLVVPCRAQTSGREPTSGFQRWDVMLNAGAAMQFSDVVNNGYAGGHDVFVLASVRASPHGNMRFWMGYDYYRTGIEDNMSGHEVSARYLSAGLRADVSARNSPVGYFFLIGFGVGSSTRSVVQNSDATLRNTAVQFGVGMPIRIGTSLHIVPMFRAIIGAESGFVIPVTAGLQWTIG